MKLISWNVNGLRACMKKGFGDFLESSGADIFAVQETKMREEQKSFAFEGRHEYWNSAVRPGYSGTLVYVRHKPDNAVYGINGLYNDEGRVITLEYDNFYFVNLYSPNSQEELSRLDYRMKYEDELRGYLSELKKKKPVVMCGDLNVAHRPIDIKNPGPNEHSAGYTIEERSKFSVLLESGFTDSFRFLYPDRVEYSWWSYRFRARERNIGWRIDYFLVSDDIRDRIRDVKIHGEVLGSDHCPVELDIDL